MRAARCSRLTRARATVLPRPHFPSAPRAHTADYGENDVQFFEDLGSRGPVPDAGEDDGDFERKKNAQLKLYRVREGDFCEDVGPRHSLLTLASASTRHCRSRMPRGR